MAYILKCILADPDTEISRTFALDPEESFLKLHYYIQHCFGFTNSHMRDFSQKDILITQLEFGTESYNQSVFDAGNTSLSKIFGKQLPPKKPVKKLLYSYDYGDSRTFDILFKGEKEVNVPSVIDTKGGILLDDIGGMLGREGYLEVAKNKDKEQAENFG